MRNKIKAIALAIIGISLSGHCQEWNSNGNNSTTGSVTVNGGGVKSNFKRKFDYNNGGWARTIIEYENSLMSSGNFKIGSYGGKTDYSYSYIGNGDYNDSTNMKIYPNGNVTFGGDIGIGGNLDMKDGNITINSGKTNTHFKRKFDYNNGGWARTIIEYENSLMSSGNFKIGSYGGKTDYSYSYIGNGDYNDSKNMKIYPNGNVTFGGDIGIGTTDTKGYKLGVNGKVIATEIKVETYSNWSDFVFEENYELPNLKEVENYIKEKGHLKDIPSAEEVETEGFFLGEMDAKLLQKIEELTLYTIAQEKKLENQEKKFDHQNSKIEKLEQENNLLKSLLERVSKLEEKLEKK